MIAPVAALAVSLAAVGVAAELPRGEVVPRVQCVKDPSFSYALYLPSTYPARRRWPVVLCFAPDARGELPAQRLKDGAERFGFIVVASNDSRNGPWAPVERAQAALWKEVRERFAIDETRVYGLGFSGGARAALKMALEHPRQFAGVISCGALMTGERPLPAKLKLAIYGISGADDLALQEYEQFDDALTASGATHWLEVFPGGHRWPDADRLTGALEFMDADARRRGLVPADEAAVERLAAARLADAAALEAAGSRWEARRAYRQLARVFAGGAAAAAAAAAVVRLDADADVRRRAEQEESLARALAALRHPEDGENFKLAWGWLGRQAAAGTPLAGRARHARTSVPDQMARLAIEGARAGNPRGADLLIEPLLAIDLDQPIVVYNLACALAVRGRTREALATLGRAVELGFTDAEGMAGDADLASLRGKPEYEALLARLRAPR